ncbi:MAG: alpha/beta hydrolase, partial [Chloroflexota bacterium]
IVIEVDGIPIVGALYLPDAVSPQPAVCICHGIPSGKPAEPGDGGYPALAERVCREGYAVMIFSFRGSGESGGNLEMTGWTRDLKGIIDFLWVHPSVDRARLAVAGFSGGAAAAVCVTAQDKRVSGVLPFACPAEFRMLTESGDPAEIVAYHRSIGTIRDDDFPPSAAEWLDGFRRIRPIDFIGGISPRPVWLVHGSKDETVPVRHAYRLFEQAGAPRKLIVIDGAGHRLRHDERAVTALFDGLRSFQQ